MARITRLHVENFRSIESLTLDLHDEATLLVGPNGSGKSNIIDALMFVCDAGALGLRKAIRQHGGISRIRRRPPSQPKSDATIDIKLEVSAVISADSYHYGFVIRTSANGGWNKLDEWFLLDQAESHYDLLMDWEIGIASDIGPMPDLLGRLHRFDINPSDLHAPQPQSAEQELDASASNLNSIWRHLTETHPNTSERIITLMKQVIETISDIRSQTVGGYEVLQVTQAMASGRALVVDGSGLSDGTLRALALLVAVYQPSKPVLAAIEEPEKALHPYAAELLFNALLSAPDGPQLLISTHSPAILTSRRVDLSMIRVVEWRDGRTIAGPIAADLREDIAERLTTAPELLAEGSLRPEEPEPDAR